MDLETIAQDCSYLAALNKKNEFKERNWFKRAN